jgi:hypothetical protein
VGLEIWVVLIKWVEIKASNSPSMDKTWEVWVEQEVWIQAKYLQCLWEVMEDSEALETLEKEANRHKKHQKHKVMEKDRKILEDFLLVILVMVVDLDHLVKILSKRVRSKNDF